MKFLSRGSGYSLFLTGNEAVLALKQGQSTVKWQKANAKGVAQRSPFNAAAYPGLFAKPESLLGWRGISRLLPNAGGGVNQFCADPTDCGTRTLKSRRACKASPALHTPTTDAVLRMKLVGANPQAKVAGTEELPGKSNYFIGNDPKKWRTNVPNYAKVKYASVYPGVDLVYYGNQGQLEYDFVVSPGADPASDHAGTVKPASSRQANQRCQQSKIDKNGDLVVSTDGGEVIFHKPSRLPADNEPRDNGLRTSLKATTCSKATT